MINHLENIASYTGEYCNHTRIKRLLVIGTHHIVSVTCLDFSFFRKEVLHLCFSLADGEWPLLAHFTGTKKRKNLACVEKKIF